MQVGSIDLNKLRGIGDKGVGITKEFVGVIINNDRLQEEGEAQQERATKELRALRKQAEAQANEAKAEAAERRERAAQGAKE